MQGKFFGHLPNPFEPVQEGLRDYNLPSLHPNWRNVRADAMAGLTVAVVAVPQSMAYAIIAGVPPEYGLYTVIFQCLIGSLFNSQKFLSVGPINTQSLLVASTVTQAMRVFGDLTPEQYNMFYLQLTIALTLLKGVMQMGMAFMRLGALVRYVSTSVIVGFTAGAAVLIAAGQVNNFLGFSVQRSSDNWPGLVGVVQRLLPHMHEIQWWAVGLGVGALVIMIVLRMISRMLPGPLIAVVATAAAVGAFGLTQEDLPLVKPLPSGLPSFTVPAEGLAQWDVLLGGALALSLLGLMEAYSIGKAIVLKTGQRISANRELFSQGTTNLVTSFFQCIPGSGSFSRSALNHYAGAATCFSGVFNSLFVAAIFLGAGPFATYIPMTALAAVLFVIAAGLIDWRYMRRLLHTDRADAAVCMGTFAATLFLPLSYAVFLGIFLNIALYLRRASSLHLVEMVQTASGPYEERPIEEDHEVGERRNQRQVMLLQLEGDLFFGLADELQDRLATVRASEAKVVIIRLKRTHSIDATALGVLDQFVIDMRAEDRYVLVCGLRTEMINRMARFGLAATIGEENIFPAQFGVFTSTKQALRRAKEIIGSSIDEDGFEKQDQMQGWAYQI